MKEVIFSDKFKTVVQVYCKICGQPNYIHTLPGEYEAFLLVKNPDSTMPNSSWMEKKVITEEICATCLVQDEIKRKRMDFLERKKYYEEFD